MKKLLLVAVFCGWGSFAQNAAPGAGFTKAQAEAGRVAYESSCVKCHTPDLLGRKGAPGEMPPVASLPDNMKKVVTDMGGMVPPLTGPAFAARWDAKTAHDLAKRIAEAVGGFPPEPNPGEAVTAVNLTAYFLERLGAKPGSTELRFETEARFGSLHPAAK